MQNKTHSERSWENKPKYQSATKNQLHYFLPLPPPQHTHSKTKRGGGGGGSVGNKANPTKSEGNQSTNQLQEGSKPSWTDGPWKKRGSSFKPICLGGCGPLPDETNGKHRPEGPEQDIESNQKPLYSSSYTLRIVRRNMVQSNSKEKTTVSETHLIVIRGYPTVSPSVKWQLKNVYNQMIGNTWTCKGMPKE